MVFSYTVSAFLVAAFGGWVYGYNTGIISGLSKPLVEGQFFANEDEQSVYEGVLTASILVGGAVGSFLGVWLSSRFGRLRSLFLCGAICVVCTIIMALLSNFAGLVIVRAFLGLSIGFTGTLCPLYVTELAPPHIRGRLGTVFQIGICASILLAEIINYGFNPSDDTELDQWKWQLQFGLGAIPGAFLIGLVFLVPESPVFLQLKSHATGRAGGGKLSPSDKEAPLLQHSNDGGDVNNNTDQPQPSMVSLADDSESVGSPPVLPESSSGSDSYGWKLLFSRPYLKHMFVAIILAAAQQMTGINAIIFYAPKIFDDAGLSNTLVLTFSVVGVWNLLSVFISFALVDRLGRRPLMIGALCVMCVAMFVLALAYAAFPDNKSVVAILSVMLFVGAFECGPGPLFFLMAAETFPTPIKNEALSFANGVSWCFNIIVSFGFPVVNDSAGSAATFFIFTGLAFGSGLLIFFLLPETKHNSDPQKSHLPDDSLRGTLDGAYENGAKNGAAAVV